MGVGGMGGFGGMHVGPNGVPLGSNGVPMTPLQRQIAMGGMVAQEMQQLRLGMVGGRGRGGRVAGGVMGRFGFMGAAGAVGQMAGGGMMGLGMMAPQVMMMGEEL